MKKLSEQLLQMKNEFDSVGIRLNGLTWQRIQRHMEEYAIEVAKEALKNAAEKAVTETIVSYSANPNDSLPIISQRIDEYSITNESNIPKL